MRTSSPRSVASLPVFLRAKSQSITPSSAYGFSAVVSDDHPKSPLGQEPHGHSLVDLTVFGQQDATRIDSRESLIQYRGLRHLQDAEFIEHGVQQLERHHRFSQKAINAGIA